MTYAGHKLAVPRAATGAAEPPSSSASTPSSTTAPSEVDGVARAVSATLIDIDAASTASSSSATTSASSSSTAPASLSPSRGGGGSPATGSTGSTAVSGAELKDVSLLDEDLSGGAGDDRLPLASHRAVDSSTDVAPAASVRIHNEVPPPPSYLLSLFLDHSFRSLALFPAVPFPPRPLLLLWTLASSWVVFVLSCRRVRYAWKNSSSDAISPCCLAITLLYVPLNSPILCVFCCVCMCKSETRRERRKREIERVCV